MASRFPRFLKRLLGVDSDPKGVASASRDLTLARENVERQFNPLTAEAGYENFPILYWHLSRKDDGPRRAEAYALLRNILSNASSHGLCRLEALCRERTSVEWDIEWTRFPLDGFCPEGITSDDKVWGYALASFHPNGFLREKAVIGLALIETGEEIPFLLLRSNDWVDQVRIRAESILEARLDSGHGEAASRLLRALPILNRLRASARRSHGPMLDRIGKRIALDGKALLSGLGSADMETRRFGFELALEAEGIGLETLQDAVLREPQGPLRFHMLRSMEKRLTFPLADGFIGRLLRDPFSPVRRLALDIRCKHALEESGGVLREMIFSPNTGVRQTARYYMNQAGGDQPAAWYRKALAGGDGKALVGALRGLGEVGERQDAELLHPFLRHERVMVVRAAIRSLGSLQASFLATLLAPFVSDARPGVSREAVLALKSRTSGLNPEKLNAARKTATLPHVRKHVLMLLFAIGYWESLPYILEALAEAKAGAKAEGKAEEKAKEKAAEKEMVEKALGRWILRSNSYFVEPDKGAKERCVDSLARFGSVLDEKARKALAFILR
jgi:hypothetical protein